MGAEWDFRGFERDFSMDFSPSDFMKVTRTWGFHGDANGIS